MTEQYLSHTKLAELVPIAEYTDFKPLSTDSYSDTEIWKTIKSKGNIKILLYCALQTAIIGSGNKVYGEFEHNGEKIDVKRIYKEYGVHDDLSLNSKIAPHELTPRRLQRFFRVQIKEYLLKNDHVFPYLWKKYSTLDSKYRVITFPGAESLVETKNEAAYLLQTYIHLDQRAGTNIAERVQRVLLARGILTMHDIQDIILI